MTFLIMLENAFTWLGTPVTWLEVWAFLLAVVGIACNIRVIHWGWPLAAASALLYFWLFAQSKLYAEANLQIFFAVTSVWGWWQWLYGKRDDVALTVVRANARVLVWSVLAWLVGWLMIGTLLARLTDSDVPYFDAFATAGSLVATVLLARKMLENWAAWIVVNVFSMGLFAYKNLYLTVVLYAILIGIAVAGHLQWRVYVKDRSA
jgi:nicotinamide mononucleotide transporter